MTSLPLPCAGKAPGDVLHPGCTVPSTEAVTFLGRVYCPRHAIVACAEALAMQRRLTGQDLFDALDILRGAIVGVRGRLRILGIDPHPAEPETERAS